MSVCSLLSPFLLPVANFSVAGYQVSADTTHGIFGQGYRTILQGAMETMFECTNEPTRRAQRAPRGQEVGIDTGKGMNSGFDPYAGDRT